MNLTLNYTLTLQNLETGLRAMKKAVATYPQAGSAKKGSKTLLSINSVGRWLVILTLAASLFIIFHKDPARAAGSPSSSDDGPLLTWLPYIIIFIVGFLFLRYRSSPRFQAKTAWQKNPDFQQPQMLTIAPNTLTMKSPTAEVTFNWEHFTHFYDAQSVFLLFDSSKTARIIPKSAFANPTDADAFADDCRSRIYHVPAAFPVLTEEPPIRG